MTAKREFFTTNEIAQILGLSPFTVRRYIQTRKLKAVKLEGSYRVRRSHLDDFIESRELETEEELKELEEAEAEIEKPRAAPAVLKIEKKKVARQAVRPLQQKSTKEIQSEIAKPAKIATKKFARSAKRKSPARSSNRRKEEA